MESLNYLLSENPIIWVFGYGSLLWKPDFCYKSKVIGFIEGYERRFNQGNETFRGAPGKPGRVANLEQKSGGKTWGVAYEISGRCEVSKVLQKLYVRESQCGGYDTMITTFFPREYATRENFEIDPINYTSSYQAAEFPHDTNSITNTVCESPLKSLQSMQGKLQSNDIDVPMNATSDVSTHNSVYPPTRGSGSENSPSLKSKSGVDKNISQILIQSSRELTTASKNKSVVSDTSSGSNTKIEHHVNLRQPVQVLLYTATPENPLYLGPETVSSMAHQIVNCKGTAGTNVEYVLKIADYVRNYIPEDNDEYLFSLDDKIREELYRQINLQRMGSNIMEKLGLDPDLEHHEALLNSIRVIAA